MRDALQVALLLLATAVVVVVVCRLLRLPALIGYLVVGILIGPHALGWYILILRISSHIWRGLARTNYAGCVVLLRKSMRTDFKFGAFHPARKLSYVI